MKHPGTIDVLKTYRRALCMRGEANILYTV